MLVVDNGAYSIKVTDESGVTRIVPNCIARSKDDRRILTGGELQEGRTLATLQFKRAHEKGYLTAWHIEKAVWDQMLRTLFIDAKRDCLVLTEAPNAPSTIQANTDEMVYEEYNFESYIRTTSAALVAWSAIPDSEIGNAIHSASVKAGEQLQACREVVLVVDSGYSFTHITPIIQGIPRPSKRVNVGGKMLTNVLKEQISFRQYNMMDETHLINAVKEECCFVSLDFAADMDRARNRELRERYVLPDLIAGVPGYKADSETVVTDDMQILELGVELFNVPELLFSPSDIGLDQGGIVNATMQALDGLPDELVALCLENIVLIGGNTKFPGFLERFERDVRALAPENFEVRVFRPDDPISFASQSGQRMARSYIQEHQVTKDQYLSSNRRATMNFNQIVTHESISLDNISGTPDLPRRRETIYDETSDRSDTPRSFSPDTEPEDQDMTDEKVNV